VPLDGPLHILLQLLARARRPTLDALGPLKARRVYEEAIRVMDFPPQALPRVEAREVPGPAGPLPLRVYWPSDGGGRPLPALLFLHGGGFVVGSAHGYDGLCRMLAARARCVVASLDYRLAPEAPFPAAVEDAVAAFRGLVALAPALGVDPARIAVGGDSAGGNLAAVVCQQQRDAGGPLPSFQLLLQPATAAHPDWPSRGLFAEGYYLTATVIDWFRRCYVGEAQEGDARAAPLAAKDLSGLPPALVVTAGFDPLRDEGEAYAAALEKAGVRARHRCHEGLVHGFASMGGVVPTAARALEQAADDLAAALWG
jgi:acetyl esterase